jgi:RHS repeat-associated protein
VSSSDVPTGFSASNANLHMWNTFYWDKLAIAQHPGDLVLARTDFDPSCRPTAVQGALEERSGFTGHRYSVVSDLSMSPSRLHDPGVGRWISEDPLGFADGPNRYAYSRNAPTTTVDPDGPLSAKVTGHDPQRFSDYTEIKWACKGIWALFPGVVYG